jgi:hypothetical protein
MALYNTPCRSYREFAEGYLVLPKSQRKRCCAFEDRFEIAGSPRFDRENFGVHAISLVILNIIDQMCDVICNLKQKIDHQL